MRRPDKFIAAANGLIGTPFRHLGRCDRLDCLGLVVVSARKAGVDLEQIARDIGVPEQCISAYSRRGDGTMARWLSRVLEPIPKVEDGAIIAIHYDGWPSHVGIVDGSSVIHATARFRRVVRHSLSGVRIVRAYRLPETT